MVSDEQISSTIGKIYDAALDPAQWTALLRAVGSLVDAPQGNLMVGSASRQRFSDYGYGRNEEAIALYNTEFAGQDPWFEPLARRGIGAVATGQELYPTRNFEHTSYYQECVKRDEVYDCLACILEGGRGLNAFIAFQRPESAPLFGESDKQVLTALVPHLRRIIQIQRQLESVSLISALQSEVLDRLPFGVVIVSGGTIMFANNAAQKIAQARDGLRLTRNRIAADHPGDDALLLDALTRAEDSRHRNGATVSVRRLSLKRSFVVQIIPVLESAACPDVFGSRERAILVAITDPDAAAQPPAVHLLMRGYGLTPAEATLAVKIGQGCSLRQAAEDLDIAEETARWHLKRVLAKTETARQSELIRLLLKVSPPLRGSI